MGGTGEMESKGASSNNRYLTFKSVDIIRIIESLGSVEDES